MSKDGNIAHTSPHENKRSFYIAPIHDRDSRQFHHMSAMPRPIYGITNPWLADLVREYIDVMNEFTLFSLANITVDDNGVYYDRVLSEQDFNYEFKQTIKTSGAVFGKRNSSGVNAFNNIKVGLKEMFIIMGIIHNDPNISIFSRECDKNEYGESHIDALIHSYPKGTWLSTIKDEFDKKFESCIINFNNTFKEALYSEDNSLLNEFTSDHARIYMMLNKLWFKNKVWDYEAYWKARVLLQHKYRELLISRYNKETKTFLKNGTLSNQQIRDKLLHKWEISEGKSYNPNPYFNMVSLDYYQVPYTFNALLNTIDVSLFTRWLKKYDKYAGLRIDLKTWNVEMWDDINRFDNILNLDNIVVDNSGVPYMVSKREYDYKFDFTKLKL